MSDDPKKTLLPEFLPPPTAEGAARPRERVNERARLLLARFRELGVTGVAVLSLNCADSRLGVGNPTARADAAAGDTGGLTGDVASSADATGTGPWVDAATAAPPDVAIPVAPPGGYGVVDPAPPPAFAECQPAADPFASLKAVAKVAAAPPDANVSLYLSPSVAGLQAANVSVTGGSLLAVDAHNASSRYSPFILITLAPTAAKDATLVVSIDLSCGAARATRKYEIVYKTSDPVGSILTVTELH
jgi:hypothetical protein